MSRIEWTRLDGGDVEAVVAMFVNRERSNSVRITPSRGDGGVDILDRAAGRDGCDVVYQVKRYTAPLQARQKQEIEGSFGTLRADERWASLNVGEWHLVMPWDPTPEAETWFQGLDEPDLEKFWHGLTWVDQHAAKYDDVVDYYLRDGRALVQKTYAEVLSLIGAGTGELTVPEVAERLRLAVQTLSHDPHYRYELGFGQGKPPPPPSDGDRPGLVMHQMKAVGNDWTTVDIIARCAASASERPITINGTITAPSDSPLAEELKSFFAYGAPFTSPYGAFDGSLDAPGGLGGTLAGAALTVGPTSDAELGRNPDLHMQVLNPAGEVLGAVDVSRTERSRGAEGLRVVLTEVNGTFELEDRYSLDGGADRKLKYGTFTRLPVTVTQEVFRFLKALREPNLLRVSVRGTPAALGVTDPNIGFSYDEEMDQYLATTLDALEPLVALQGHARDLIRTPDLAAVTQKQVATWRAIARMLQGEVLTSSYPEGHALLVDLPMEVTVPANEDLQILRPLTVTVGDQEIDLGHQVAVLPSPTLVDRQEREGHAVHAFTTPNRTIRWRRHDG